ncbi:uncharacterized protein PG998_008462 [Apiospora kogelbergensis]|uniref:uncharacterized protein n=1 Tax=Apiospora kogelbergensis TaxID=1337665 RepID=UPI00312EE44A
MSGDMAKGRRRSLPACNALSIMHHPHHTTIPAAYAILGGTMSLVGPQLPPTQLIPPPTVINDENKVYSIAAACIFLGILASLFALTRLVGRIWCRNFGLDDYAAAVALAFYIGWTIFAGYINLNAGVGKPLWETTVGEWSLFWRSALIATFLYPSVSGTIRISTVLFYQRVFAVGRAMKIALHVLLALQVVFIIVFTVTPGFICQPISAINDPFTVLVQCDFKFFLHQPDLRLPRLKYAMSLYIPTQFTDYGTTFWIPCQVEPALAIIGISLPALRQLYLQIRGTNQTTTTVRGSSAGNSKSGATVGSKRAVGSSSHPAAAYPRADGSYVELRPYQSNTSAPRTSQNMDAADAAQRRSYV